MSEAKPTAAGQLSDRQRPAHFRRPPVALRGEKTVASLGLWQRWLLGWHSRVFDREGARNERISTAEPAQLADLTIESPNLTYANDYRPSPRHLIGWALDCLPEAVDDFVFIDVGSGRGRVLFEAARRPFERIVSIEFAEELHEDADTNLRHWPRSQMACRDIDLVHGDALDESLPEADLVVYMFKPVRPAANAQFHRETQCARRGVPGSGHCARSAQCRPAAREFVFRRGEADAGPGFSLRVLEPLSPRSVPLPWVFAGRK